MRKTLSYLTAALLMLAGTASAEIVIIQAEDAVDLGTNWVVVADTNVPPIAFGGSYLTQQVSRTDATLGDEAYWSVGNLTSNAAYDVYMRLHVGPGGFNDDSIFPATGFNVSNSFAFVNQLAGVSGLDGMVLTSTGFHWTKVVSAINAGDGTNLVYYAAPREDGLEFDALAFVPAGIPVTDAMLDPANAGAVLLPVSVAPAGATDDTTPLIEVTIHDGTETVNSNSITFMIDGVGISSNVQFSYTNTISTISYTPVIPFDQPSTHTAKVVVASYPSGTLVTNEWSFDVLIPISYVDAGPKNTVMATSTNGPVGAGTALITTGSNVRDGFWALRTGYGIATNVTIVPLGDGAISPLTDTNNLLENTGYDDAQLDNVPRLKTSVTGLADDTYEVYIYFWNDQADYQIRAGLEDTPGTNSLALITNYTAIATDPKPRELRQAFLGYVTGTSIDVYVEDGPSTAGINRTWYDGIGYRALAAPAINPDIQSVSISGGTATLTWVSETVGTYSILHKTNLTDAVWTPVKTGIAGGDPTTTDSVSVSGDGQEFFSIEGD